MYDWYAGTDGGTYVCGLSGKPDNGLSYVKLTVHRKQTAIHKYHYANGDWQVEIQPVTDQASISGLTYEQQESL